MTFAFFKYNMYIYYIFIPVKLDWKSLLRWVMTDAITFTWWDS